jgi:DNA-binding HxlR family transcriptional regulator
LEENNFISSLEKSKATQIMVSLLNQGSMSFTQLISYTGGSPRTLIDRIDELSKNKLITVKKETKFPFREEIELTAKGTEIAKLLRSAYKLSEKGLSRNEKILLFMMYRLGNIIKGTTRIEKLPFILKHELGVDLKYHYIPMEYGPYSVELLEEIGLLENKGYITIQSNIVTVKDKDEEKEVERRMYCLTSKGLKKAQEVSKKISAEIQEAINKLDNYNKMPLSDLLDFVHKKYPEYRKRSNNC